MCLNFQNLASDAETNERRLLETRSVDCIGRIWAANSCGCECESAGQVFHGDVPADERAITAAERVQEGDAAEAAERSTLRCRSGEDCREERNDTEVRRLYPDAFEDSLTSGLSSAVCERGLERLKAGEVYKGGAKLR